VAHTIETPGRIASAPLIWIAALALFAAVAPSGASAQTPFSSLAQPNGPPTTSRPAPAAKAEATALAKGCSRYGAGYVNVPGTDTCVKIGAAVRTEVGANVR
jgi:hypothetical protein